MKRLLIGSSSVSAVLLLLCAVAACGVLPTPTPSRAALPVATSTLPASPPATPAQAVKPTATQPASPLPTPIASIPSLDRYVFGQPHVVVTSTWSMDIAGWLPDSERLLLLRSAPSPSNQDYIETFNVRTGQARRYAQRLGVMEKPVWLPALQGVAFADMILVGGRVTETDLRIVGGTAGQEWTINGLASGWLAADPSGQRVLFMPDSSEKRPSVYRVAQATVAPLSISLAAREDTQRDREPLVMPYQMAWHPTQPVVVLYNNHYLFIANLDGGEVQAVNLRQSPYQDHAMWAFVAHWSPDGRYLALLVTEGIPPVHFTDLAVLDTSSGFLRRIDTGQQYVTEVAWSPNSAHLALEAEVSQQDGVGRHGLYLADVGTGALRRMLPDLLFVGASSFGSGLAWSPDGRTLAAACPVPQGTSVCLVQVKVEP